MKSEKKKIDFEGAVVSLHRIIVNTKEYVDIADGIRWTGKNGKQLSWVVDIQNAILFKIWNNLYDLFQEKQCKICSFENILKVAKIDDKFKEQFMHYGVSEDKQIIEIKNLISENRQRVKDIASYVKHNYFHEYQPEYERKCGEVPLNELQKITDVSWTIFNKFNLLLKCGTVTMLGPNYEKLKISSQARDVFQKAYNKYHNTYKVILGTQKSSSFKHQIQFGDIVVFKGNNWVKGGQEFKIISHISEIPSVLYEGNEININELAAKLLKLKKANGFTKFSLKGEERTLSKRNIYNLSNDKK